MELSIGEIIAWYAVFVFSTTLHEAAHSWAGRRGGDHTAHNEGLVSLDPLPHMKRSPIGMVVLPLITLLTSGWPIGFASAPYDAHWAYQYPRRAAKMAMAGPLANLLLVLLSVVVIRAGIFLGFFEVPDYVNVGYVVMGASEGWSSTLASLLSIIFCMNLVLFVLNMIPLPPLDGRELLTFFISEDKARAYQETLHQHSNMMFIGMIAAWHLFGPVFEVIFLTVVNLVYPGYHFG